MLSKEQKKEVIKNYKEQKPALGVYAIRCSEDRRVWVGASRNLSATRNSVWFSLRIGSSRDRTLQDAWRRYGESCFTFATLEVLDDDVSPLAVGDLLRERKEHWLAALHAEPLL